MGAVEHANMTCICASNAPRHPCSLKFVKAAGWILCQRWCQHEPAEEVVSPPCNEGVEEL